MKIVVAGATGLVGETMLRVLEEQSVPVNELIPVASAASVGKIIQFKNRAVKVVSIEEALDKQPDIALFSAGGAFSKVWAPHFANRGVFVIDNSSAWRMHDQVPLVVPELNAHTIHKDSFIIANPNCSTIQLVIAIAPIHQHFRLKRLVISTYQSVTGSGYQGMNQLQQEQKNMPVNHPAYPHPIHQNLIPQGGDFDFEGYTTEERKLEYESRKILSVESLAITATVVRVPVMGGHSMTVNAQTETAFQLPEIRALLDNSPGLELLDDPASHTYPMPLFAEGKDAVFVGRIRKDNSIKNGLNLWIVADNLRKGAATNAVQIASYLFNNNFLANSSL